MYAMMMHAGQSAALQYRTAATRITRACISEEASDDELLPLAAPKEFIHPTISWTDPLCIISLWRRIRHGVCL